MRKTTCFLGLMLLFLSACSPRVHSKTSEDASFEIVWVGDESLSFVPMQTLLMLSEGGQRTLNIKNESFLGAGNTIASGGIPPSVIEYLSSSAVDLVIVQAFSAGETSPSEVFEEHAKQWVDDLSTLKIDMVLYFPQKIADQEEEVYQSMLQSTLQAAWAHQLPVVPIGKVWERLNNEPGLTLTENSPNHLSPAGVYLNASMFYTLFSGNLAETNPVKTSIGFTQPDTIVILDQTITDPIHSAMRQVIEEYQKQDEFTIYYPLTDEP